MSKERKEFLEYAKYDQRLLKLEIAVIDFAKTNRSIKNRRKYFVHDVWYGYNKYANKGFKHQVCSLVGYEATVKELKSCEAYDVVYQYIYNIL